MRFQCERAFSRVGSYLVVSDRLLAVWFPRQRYRESRKPDTRLQVFSVLHRAGLRQLMLCSRRRGRWGFIACGVFRSLLPLSLFYSPPPPAHRHLSLSLSPSISSDSCIASAFCVRPPPKPATCCTLPSSPPGACLAPTRQLSTLTPEK